MREIKYFKIKIRGKVFTSQEIGSFSTFICLKLKWVYTDFISLDIINYWVNRVPLKDGSTFMSYCINYF